MKKFLFIFTLITSGAFAQKIDINKQFALAGQQYLRMLADHPDTSVTIHSAKPDGTYRNLPSSWCMLLIVQQFDVLFIIII